MAPNRSPPPTSTTTITTTPSPPRLTIPAPSLDLITMLRTSSPTSPRSSISKSAGSSPRSPLLLCTTEPSALSLTDDPTLDMDFELLFLHDDDASSSKSGTRPRQSREKTTSSFIEKWSPAPAQHTKPAPAPAGRSDWSTFRFSHYANVGGAVGLRGKGRVGEMYVRNRAQMGR